MSEEQGSHWSLQLTLPGEEPLVFHDLSFQTPTCYKLNWIGFTSNATKPTTFYLDNFALRP